MAAAHGFQGVCLLWPESALVRLDVEKSADILELDRLEPLRTAAVTSNSLGHALIRAYVALVVACVAAHRVPSEPVLGAPGRTGPF
ncbi:hypothetical protein [Cryobacterium sp. BB736]|uniref:hypothetical protein n=1 Tax=Cryobacterium sp. BB736 TaxID=2746963 RepID=UPI00187649B8|nr:hypothetical protein [Cryobacterium sp. BB736]